MMSVLTSALSNEMLPLGSLSNGPMLPTPHGQPGLTSAPPSTLTPHCTPQTTQSCPSNSSPIVTVGDKYLPAGLLSVAAQWETPFVPLDRRCPTWATQTLDFFPPEN
jgi:hypothetical protein